jgi:hypothetical protein
LVRATGHITPGGDYDDAHDHIIVIEFEIRPRHRRLLACSRRTPLSFLAALFFWPTSSPDVLRFKGFLLADEQSLVPKVVGFS